MKRRALLHWCRHLLQRPGPWPIRHTIKLFDSMQAYLHEASRITSLVPPLPAVPWVMAFLAHHQVVRLQAGEPP